MLELVYHFVSKGVEHLLLSLAAGVDVQPWLVVVIVVEAHNRARHVVALAAGQEYTRELTSEQLGVQSSVPVA